MYSLFVALEKGRDSIQSTITPDGGAHWGGDGKRFAVRGWLVSAAAAKYDLSGLYQDVQIQQDRLAAHVVNIENNAPPIVSVISTGNLPKPRNTWFGRQIPVQMAPISQQLFADHRSGAHQAHFSPDDIPELRQFVQAGTPKKATDARNTWVVTELMVTQPFSLELWMTLQKVTQYPVRIWNHTAELQAIESFTVATDATVPKDDRATLAAQEYGNGQDQGCKDDTQERRTRDIQHPF
jgi:hypothetical protein